MEGISKETLERRESGRLAHEEGVCLPRSEPTTQLGGLGLKVSRLDEDGEHPCWGGVLQILELPVEESSYPGPIRSQGRSLPSRSALACLISRRVEAWRYQGQRSSDVTKEHVLSQ